MDTPRLNTDDPTPLSRQIDEEIRSYILVGLAQPGDPLPSIRALAAKLAINPGTVARAYKALVQGGYATVVRGRGTFISGSQPFPPRAHPHRAQLLGTARRYAILALLTDDVEEAQRQLDLYLDFG